MKRHALLLWVGLFLLNGCAHQIKQDQLQADYESSIVSAAMHKRDKPSRPLVVIKNPHSRFLTFSAYTAYRLSDNKLPETIWVTVEPEIKKICSQYFKAHGKKLSNDQLSLFITQLLGLPPASAAKRRFIVFSMPIIQAYYGPSPRKIGIFRPCADPRVGPHADGSPICPKAINAKDAYLSWDFKTWYRHNEIASYKEHGYPWTGTGYTYNWNRQARNKTGVSEFVVLKNTPIKILPNPKKWDTPYIEVKEYCAGA